MRVASLLEEAFDHIGQGILLFDSEQRLVGINAPCTELLELPVELTAPGTRHETILHWMIERGDCGAGAKDRLLAELMIMPAAGEQIRTERRLPGGRVLEVRSALLPGGGLVVERSAKSSDPPFEGLSLIDERRYGDTRLTLLQRPAAPEQP